MSDLFLKINIRLLFNFYPADIQQFFYSKMKFAGGKAKGRISKRVFQENKAHACAYQGVRNVRFSENLACFVFLKYPF